MRFGAACAAFVLMSAALHATVVLPIDFRELVTSSAVIVHGRISVRDGVLTGDAKGHTVRAI